MKLVTEYDSPNRQAIIIKKNIIIGDITLLVESKFIPYAEDKFEDIWFELF